MADRKSSIKRIRSDVRKTERNRRRKSTLRTTLRKAEVAITGEDRQLAQESYRQALSHLDRAAQKGVIKRGTADRKKSRLARRFNQAATA